MIREAEKAREEAPPALGIGDLVADKIAPDSARIFPDFLKVEGRYHTTLFASGWPDEVFFGMLADLNRIEGRVKVVKFVDPRPKKEAQQILGGRVAALRASKRTADDGNVNAEQQREIAEYTNEQALYEINSGRQRYLTISVLIHIEAGSEERLYGMAQEVQDTLAGWNVSCQLAREQAWEGLLSSGPFGKNYLSDRYCEFGMLSRPAACLFSYGSQQIDHENGVFLGVDRRSNSVMTLDTRRLVNPHGVILGQTGGGKSFVIKCVSTRQLLLGNRQVIIDPEGNSRYVRVAKAVGGAYAVIAPGSKHKINPFDLHEDYMNLDLLEDIFGDEDEDEEDEEEDVEEAVEAARAAALDGKAQEITRMVSLMAVTDETNTGAVGGLSGAEASFVERAVYQAYEDAGIRSDDPETHNRPAPTFPEFWRIMHGYAEATPIVSGLLEKLWSWHSGSLSKIFDAPTNVDLSNKYLVFQISKVKDRQKAPVMHAILEFLNGVLSNRNEPSDCWIDEGWALLAFPMSAEFTETMYRSGRARDNGMWLASQAVNEFVESRQGNVILDLAATHMIFRHEHTKSASATASIHDLSEEETEELLNFQPGEGYLIVDQARVPMEVLASDREKELYNTSPRIEAANKEKRRRLAEARRRVEDAEREGAAEASRGERSAMPGMPRGGESMRVYAFAGDGGAVAAAGVAKLYGRAARKERLYVLAVDACGGALFEELSSARGQNTPAPPDSFLRLGFPDPETLGDHVARTGLSALKAVGPPRNPALPASPLHEAAGGVFDLCIVACGESTSPYAEDWLLVADKVVACSSEGAQVAFEAALAAEETRASNGTILAVTGAGGPPVTTFPEGDGGASRPLYSLGPGAGSGTQAGRGLRSLARALVAPKDEPNLDDGRRQTPTAEHAAGQSSKGGSQ